MIEIIPHAKFQLQFTFESSITKTVLSMQPLGHSKVFFPFAHMKGP